MLKTTQWKWVMGHGLEETQSKCEMSRHSMVEEGDEHWCSNTHGCDGGPGVCTQDNAAKVGDELSRSNKHVWAGTSNRARDNMVGVGDRQSGSRQHHWSGRRVTWLERAWWRCDTSSCTRIDTVRVGDERSGSRVHGGGGTQVVGLELT